MKTIRLGEAVLLPNGSVRMDGEIVGRVREVGVGRFLALLPDGVEIGVYRTRRNAADAVLATAL